MADHLIFSEDGITEKAKINDTANELKLITNEGTDIISMKLGSSVSTNTLELKEDTIDSTKNALYIHTEQASASLDKILTNSTTDLGEIVDAVEANVNTFTAANTFSVSTTTTGITNTGINNITDINKSHSKTLSVMLGAILY